MRRGYKEARDRVESLLKYVQKEEDYLTQLEAWTIGGYPATEEMKAPFRRDANQRLERARAELQQAEQAFSTFEKKRVGRRFFDVNITVHLSFNQDLHSAILERQKAENIGLAELIRRALSAYLLVQK